MTIRRKTILVLSAAFCVFAVLEAVFLYRVILKSFSELEAEDAARNMERVVRAIESEISHVSAVARDWGAWDDSWRYMSDKNREFADSNLLENTFETTGVNLIYLVEPSGKVAWGGILTKENHWISSLAEFPEDALPKDHPLLCAQWDDESKSNSLAGKSGIMLTGKAPLMAAGQPIVTSTNRGPSRGTIIMGAFLDDRAVRRISEQTQVKFSIRKEKPGAGADGQFKTVTVRHRNYFLDPQNRERLVVETALSDISGKTAITLSAVLSRDLHQRGQGVLAFVLVFTLGVFATCFASIVILNRRAILSPLMRMTAHARTIESTGDLSTRLGMKRKDEIGSLARAFDRMVERVESISRDLAGANAALKEDIARREEMEEALRRNEEYFRSVFQSMRDEILVISPGLTVEDANREKLDILGFSRTQARGLKLPAVFAEFCPECVFSDGWGKLEAVFETGLPNSSRMEIARPEGTVFLDALFSPMSGPDGRVLRVIAAFRDVSAEENLSRKVSAMRKMQAVGTLAGGVAHEFNNILMSMLLNIEYALKKFPPEDPAAEALSFSLASGRRARDLILQLLAFSRGAADEPSVISVSPIIKETLKVVLSGTARNIRISFEKKAQNDMVRATPSAIQQIVMNLCGNAVWAMRKTGGELTISLDQDMAKEGGEQLLRLTVSDTGPGMPPGVMERVFEPFFTTKNPGEGAGLGLAVVHGLVSEMGGFVRVSAGSAKGVTFQVFLPLAGDMGASTVPAPAEHRGVNILLVENDGDQAHSLDRLLTGMGYWVALERNGMDALEAVVSAPKAVDVIVASFSLPSISGLALARSLFQRGLRIPFILLSTPGDPLGPGDLNDDSISVYAQKPISVTELDRVISSLVKTVQ